MAIIFLASVFVLESPPARGDASLAAVHPNILLVLTDDQRFDSLRVMKNVQRLMDHGITFNHAFVSNSLCCPSRVTINTGGLSHTTGVYTVVYTEESPYGGFEAFRRSGGENGTIAVALQDAGYRTGIVGKYLNNYAGPHVPPGWDTWAAFSDTHSGGAYYDYNLFVHDQTGDTFEWYGSDPSDYSTTVIQRKAMSFLRSTPTSTPFFLEVTPFAPHGEIVPAPADVGTFSGRTTDKDLPPTFNERDRSDKPPFIETHDPVSKTDEENRYDLQYEALQAVDRMLGKILDELRTSGRLNNTLVLFMSDNGVEYGEHRWLYKLVPYEESIRVPFVVRYPTMTKPRAGTVSKAIVANVDVAPTFADVAGIGDQFTGVGTVDGVSIAPILDGSAQSVRRDLLLEHIDYPTKFHVPSYCGLRTRGWMYTRYADGFQELYRMWSDPYEAHNVAGDGLAVLARLRRRTRLLCDPLPPGYPWS